MVKRRRRRRMETRANNQTGLLLLGALLLKTKKEIYDRGKEGFAAYAKSMDASQQEKAKILPYIKPGKIAEMGCGNGAVLELIANTFSDSKVIGVDVSDTMLKMSSERDYKNKNVTLVQDDIKKKLFPDNSLDSIVYCSVLHEVYSYSGYSEEALKETLKNAYDMLSPGGRIIIRDGVKPEDGYLFMKFKNEKTEERFKRFAEEFGPHKIAYEKTGQGYLLESKDAMEFLSKYIYEKNWAIEVKEQFGIYTPKEYAQELEKTGFKIIHNESYLIPWLKETHYEKDVELYRNNKITGEFERAKYPDSTMILVAEKPEEAEE